ncbi:acyl carrier protein [Streptomyces diastaticus]|uniref:Carrier domain-containing protein n=1 Tax=Streptomyces diastaticus subsp. diastaticus TaxID=68040 RepID=A0ABQ1CRT8_STRDI|nr:acyl carrier protein [Streptomyces diastaticus]GFH73007.1 hypothetical protein Sdia_37750 [Streptomyces diastaticus subsp. diastaticus]GGU25797.1 hypothetical protein GCM10015534_30550 [Streptomyces diastaticus subsp. diastaticus]
MTGTPADRDTTAVADWIAAQLCAELPLPAEQLNRQATFFSLGLTSQAAVAMVSRLAVRLGRDVPAATLWASPTVNGFARRGGLRGGRRRRAGGPTDRRDAAG